MIAQTLAMASSSHEVTIAAFGIPKDAEAPAGIAEVIRLERPSVGGIVANLLRTPSEPLQAHLFMSSSARSALSDWARRNAPSVVMVDMIRLAGYARCLRREVPEARIVLDMDDLLSDRYRQMRGGNGDILGSFASGMPKVVRKVASALPSVLLSVESVLMEKAESRARDEMDAVVLVSGLEARKLAGRGSGAASVHDVPPTVADLPPVPRDFSRGARFVFFGDETYAPNAEALAIFDRIAARFPGVRFQAAGRIDSAVKTRHVERLGFVEDLDGFLGPDAIMLAPIMTGTGIKTKLLDAFSRSVPVIATRKGLEGIDVPVPEGAIAVEGEAAFVEQVKQVLGTPDFGGVERIGLVGHAAVRVSHEDGRVRRNLASALGS